MSKNKNVTVTLPAFDLEAVTALTAQGISVIIATTEPSASATALRAKRPGQPEGLKAAKKHCYDRRMARAEATKKGGLTEAHRKELAKEMRDAGLEPKGKAWTKAVVAFKKAGRHI